MIRWKLNYFCSVRSFLSQKIVLLLFKVNSTDGDTVTSVTVSLPASRRSSRRGSVDLGAMPPTARRSRRNSIDLYTAEYDVKLSNRFFQFVSIEYSPCNRISETHQSQTYQSSQFYLCDFLWPSRPSFYQLICNSYYFLYIFKSF